MVLAAPGLLTTVEVGTSPVVWKMRCTRRAMMSGEPPGEEPTTSSTVFVGFHSCARPPVARVHATSAPSAISACLLVAAIAESPRSFFCGDIVTAASGSVTGAGPLTPGRALLCLAILPSPAFRHLRSSPYFVIVTY